tara:strand:- start:265 stop:675 length:411 start_codon:yes stop_codon:yes gene_type:complete
VPKFSKKSKENLSGVDPVLKMLFTEVVKHFDCSVTEGLRSLERQKELVKKGASKTLKSKHIDGMAVDVVAYPIDYEDTKRNYYFGGFVMGMAKAMGLPLRWGGDWDGDTMLSGRDPDQTFDDLVHFEIKAVNGDKR